MKAISVLLTLLVLLALGYGVFALVSNTRDEVPVEEGDSPENEDDTEDPAGDDTDDQAALPDTVNVYVVDLEAGNVGCGDGIVPVEQSIEPTEGVLVAALEGLFALNAEEYGPDQTYYNALENSNLTVESAEVEGGVATVEIVGDVSVGGVCDSPRFEEQIRQTVLQFETVNSADISVNGTPLEELFDAQG